jgi:hypothetical protein
MRTLLLILAALTVIGTGFWAYRENYATQAALDEAAALNARITDAKARLAVLGAEWAYLNRPDRLRDLAELNFDRLGLMPLRAEHFARPADLQRLVPPVDPLPRMIITNSIALSSEGAEQP